MVDFEALSGRQSTMPEIPLRVTLENSCDRELVDRGHALDVAVRRTPVEAIVNTGIVSLLIPEEVANALGLRRTGTRTVVSADERREQWPVGRGVTIEIGSLVTQTECIIGPAGSQVLIGRVVLEALNLVADFATGTLALRHPEGPVSALRLAHMLRRFSPSR